MFDPRKQIPNFHNPVTTFNDTNWEPHNFDFHVSQKHGNIQSKDQKIEDDDESGASSPALWQNSPSRSPINYRSLSPNSRTQAIARGQWELMEMVKNMPESCFELSLKDLVEQTKSFESQEECLINSNSEKNQAMIQKRVNIKKNEQIRKAKMMMRSKSIENGGVFIKMVTPVSLRSKKTKNKNSSVNTTRVSPKPEECENSTSKNLEKDWWKKRFSGSSSSNSTGSSGRNSSRGSSTSSRNNNNRKREGLLSSCWSSLCLSEKNKVMTDLDW
ncbi:uncharacterized protein [Solanum lycopersicum]|uniref:Oidium resistance required protein 1 n=1 Tax=Solanum lycopersicum TaxID=4081 RepID=A0A3Q7GTH3_SOLLC|nr:uncharacterized protein LOC101243720 [Solanum lycopersicum]